MPNDDVSFQGKLLKKKTVEVKENQDSKIQRTKIKKKTPKLKLIFKYLLNSKV